MRNFITALAFLAAAGQHSYCQSFDDLHDFAGGADGFSPFSTLTEIARGIFIGSAAAYSPNGGVIFAVSSSGEFKTIYTLDASSQGGTPEGELLPSSSGLFYGATANRGPNNGGTLFTVTLGGKFSVIQSNVTSPSPLVEAADGNFYGIDGNYDGMPVTPTFFKMTPLGVKTTLATLPRPETTYGPLCQASDGNFYGGTSGPFTGANSMGTLFRVTPDGGYTLLHAFAGLAGNGGSLMQASNGLLYGVTMNSSSNCATSRGGVFSLSLTGSFNFVHEFGCTEFGSGAGSGLIEASDGYLYGACTLCGSGMSGSVFRIALDGSGFSTLVSFQNAFPAPEGAGVIQGSDGDLYGTAQGGGANNLGFVYRVSISAPPPLPQLSYARPASAVPGTKVIIRGNHFLATSQVTFNGIPAAFTVRDVEYIALTVPEGATSGIIAVTTPNGTGTSKFSFIVE